MKKNCRISFMIRLFQHFFREKRGGFNVPGGDRKENSFTAT